MFPSNVRTGGLELSRKLEEKEEQRGREKKTSLCSLALGVQVPGYKQQKLHVQLEC